MKQLRFYPTVIYILGICLLGMILSMKCNAQAYVSFEGQNKGFGLNAGGIINRVDFKAGYNAPVSNKASVPSIIYGSVGYEIFLSDLDNGNFEMTPSFGFAKYRVTDFSKIDVGEEINTGASFASIEIGKNFITGGGYHYGRYYVFVNHAVKTFIGAGLRIYIQ